VRFRAIVLSHDAGAVQLLTRVLRDLGVGVEHFSKHADALVRMTQRPVDAIIVDADEPEQALSLLETAKQLSTCKRALGIVLSRSGAGQKTPTGVHIVLYKPISVERVAHGLRAIRNLMARERRAGSYRVPVEIQASVRGERIGTVDVVLIDLSEGGAAIRSEKSLPATGLLSLECQLPETSALMSATAEVVWTDTKTQFGVRFVSLSSGSRGTLANWLKGNAHLARNTARGRAAGN
jgi:hypothetical protein